MSHSQEAFTKCLAITFGDSGCPLKLTQSGWTTELNFVSRVTAIMEESRKLILALASIFLTCGGLILIYSGMIVSSFIGLFDGEGNEWC